MKVEIEKTGYGERLNIMIREDVNPEEIINGILRYLKDSNPQLKLRHTQNVSPPNIEERLLGYATTISIRGVSGCKQTFGYIHNEQDLTPKNALMLTDVCEKLYVRLRTYDRMTIGNSVRIYPIREDFMEKLKIFTDEEVYKKYLPTTQTS